MPYKDKRKNEACQKEWDRKKREEADKVFGTKCWICGREPKNFRHPLHNKSGEEHAHTNTGAIALKNPEQWVRLCYRCHNGVHFCMKQFGWDWDKIISFLG